MMQASLQPSLAIHNSKLQVLAQKSKYRVLTNSSTEWPPATTNLSYGQKQFDFIIVVIAETA